MNSVVSSSMHYVNHRLCMHDDCRHLPTDLTTGLATIRDVSRTPKGGRRKSVFGLNIRRQREAAGLSQKELAERAGLGRPALSDIERGVAPNPRQETLEALARALGKPLSALAQTSERDPETEAAIQLYLHSPWGQIDNPNQDEVSALTTACVVQWRGQRPSPEAIHYVVLAIRAGPKLVIDA